MVILATVAVVGLLLTVAGIRLLSRGSSGSRPDQARPGPVLLVPGYGGSQAALSQLAGRLEAAGRTARVLTLPLWTGMDDEQVDGVGAVMARLAGRQDRG